MRTVIKVLRAAADLLENMHVLATLPGRVDALQRWAAQELAMRGGPGMPAPVWTEDGQRLLHEVLQRAAGVAG